MPLRKAILGVALVVVVGVLALAEAMPQKLAATGFMGRTGQTTVIADTDLASQARDLPYWPVIVWGGHRENSIYVDHLKQAMVLQHPAMVL